MVSINKFHDDRRVHERNVRPHCRITGSNASKILKASGRELQKVISDSLKRAKVRYQRKSDVVRQVADRAENLVMEVAVEEDDDDEGAEWD